MKKKSHGQPLTDQSVFCEIPIGCSWIIDVQQKVLCVKLEGFHAYKYLHHTHVYLSLSLRFFVLQCCIVMQLTLCSV